MIKKLKEDLANQILAWVKAQNLPQRELAQIFNLPQPRISNLVTGQLEKFSVEALLEMVVSTGYSYSVVVDSDAELRIVFNKIQE